MGSKCAPNVPVSSRRLLLRHEVQVFDLWSAHLIKSMPLNNLADKIIGVDASYYLESFLAPQVKEPLLSALGGFPLALEQAIIKDIQALQTAGLKLQFVFNGLNHDTLDDPFRPSIESARANAAAFKTYDADMANEAIIEFKKTGMQRKLPVEGNRTTAKRSQDLRLLQVCRNSLKKCFMNRMWILL